MAEPSAPDSRAPRRIVPIGTKLAAATALLMIGVSAVIYVNLTAHERENLLRAKELAASAVTRLFADSAAAAVIFEDEENLVAELHTLAHDPELEYAGVWAIDQSGKVGPRLAEVR